MKEVFLYLFKLFIGLLLVFIIHLSILYYLEKPLFSNLIVLTYVVNYILAVVVLLMIQKSLKNKSSQSGFLFMAGSGLKFLVFFLFFYPVYRENGIMETIEFVTFFIPYSFCLAADVLYLTNQLNSQSYSE